MYGPPSRGSGGAGASGEQPRVYQVWKGSNVSTRTTPVSLALCLGFRVPVNSGSGSGCTVISEGSLRWHRLP
jgi:hypothetical protein